MAFPMFGVLAALALPAGASAQPLRLFHTGAPCTVKPCTDWRVTAEADGRSFPAVVQFGRLRLARSIQAPAMGGLVDVLVDGDVRQVKAPGRDYDAVTVRKLTGVAPHSESLAAVAPAIVLAQAAGAPPPAPPRSPTPGPTSLPATPTPPSTTPPPASPAPGDAVTPAVPPEVVAPGK